MYSLATSLILNGLFLNQSDLVADSFLYSNQEKVSIFNNSEQLTLMHGIKFHEAIDITQYFVSEKLDGIRAYWDGKYLWSRQGIIIRAPHSLTSELPVVPLDGELWLGRGGFEEISGLVQRNDPDHSSWNKVSFAVFDAPYLSGTFKERYSALKSLLISPNKASLAYPVFTIPQTKLKSESELFDYLDNIVSEGGEGLILHKVTNPYQFRRTNNVLKLKPEHIMRARVLAYKPGNGKYKDLVGSLKVISRTGVEFYVGSGLTDQLRNNPPSINSEVCVLHTGFTAKGMPRFPRYTQFCN